jgi:hypothetical protein
MTAFEQPNTDAGCQHMEFKLTFFIYFFMVCIGVLLLTGCVTLPDNARWGQNATLFPGWQRIFSAFKDAVISPETWGPGAAAVVFQIGGLDDNLSDWASEQTPLFGSQKNADTASDYLRDTTAGAYLMTALTTSSGKNLDEWSVDKIKGVSIGGAAMASILGATALLKNGISRTRPDNTDKKSHPSGHASSAAGFATLAKRNLRFVPISKQNTKLLGAGFTTLAAGTAWARVEANKHFPSDILAGYALGHFISAFVNDAFLGPEKKNDPGITVEPSKSGVLFGLRWVY